MYYNSSKYCIGPDPELECQNDRILAKQVDDLTCPQYIETFEKSNLTLSCVHDHLGLTESKILKVILQDPMKMFVVRFYDSKQPSQRTNSIWNEVLEKIESSQLYQAVVAHQIQCDKNSIERDYCDSFRLHDVPEVLVFRENKVAGYFSQKHDMDDFNLESMIAVIDDLNHVNPMAAHYTNPKANVTQYRCSYFVG